MNWRLLPFDLGLSERHFALSDALVKAAPAASVWWHTTERPTLILGAGQRRLDVSIALSNGTRVVHRNAGGTAVYAGPGVLGLDVFLPASHILNGTDVVETYRWLGEVWLHALARLGVQGSLAGIDQVRSQPPVTPDVAMVCFGRLSPYEVTVAGRKLVGFAQVRRARGTLLQAGIHLQFDALGLARNLPVPDVTRLAAQLQETAIGLNDVAPHPTTARDVAAAVNIEIATRTGERLIPAYWTANELVYADQTLRSAEI